MNKCHSFNPMGKMKCEFTIKHNCQTIGSWYFDLDQEIILDFDYNWDSTYDYDFIIRIGELVMEFDDGDYRDWDDNDELLLTQRDKQIYPIHGIKRKIDIDNEKYFLFDNIVWEVEIVGNRLNKINSMKIDYQTKYYFPDETTVINVPTDIVPKELFDKYENDFFWIFEYHHMFYFVSVNTTANENIVELFSEHRIVIDENELDRWQKFVDHLNKNKSSIEYVMDQGHNLEMYIDDVMVMYLFDCDYILKWHSLQ